MQNIIHRTHKKREKMKNSKNFLRNSALAVLLPFALFMGCNDLNTGISDTNDESGKDSHDNLSQTIEPVQLGEYCNFVILAKSGISTVPDSDITGNIGVSPIAQSAITGFALTDGDGYATSAQVSGFVYAADQEEPTPTNLTVAVNDMEAAYTDAANRPNPVETERNNGELGGEVFEAGIYKWSTVVTASGDFTISGDEDDVWVFQIADNLTVSSDVNLTLIGGAQASNVFWQVGGSATIGTNAHFEGIILSQTSIHLQTGASLIGKLLAQTAVTLDQNIITDSGCSKASDDDNGNGNSIGDFGLLTPVDDCESVLSCPDQVVFEWETAQSDETVTYYIHFDAPDGDFSDPLVTELSDGDGTSTTFTVDIAFINEFLKSQDVDLGVEVSYIWTISAHIGDDIVKFSDDIFILNMVRCDTE